MQPRARIVTGDFARTDLLARFDLAIGNPPFSDRTVRSDRALRSQGLCLHDFFLVKAIKLLKPGGLAAFVTSHGTMNKADGSARELIAKHADLLGAIRLPGGSFRADAGTDVVVDILFFRRRKHGETIPDELPEEHDYTRALSLSRLAYDLESLLSPTLAAALLTLVTFNWLFFGTVIGFFCSEALVVSVTIPLPSASRPRR